MYLRMMPSLSMCSSARGASPEADESCIAPMLDGKSFSNAPTAQRWREAGSTRDVMKTEPNPPNWEVLAGMVERVTYQNAENGVVLKLVHEPESVSAEPAKKTLIAFAVGCRSRPGGGPRLPGGSPGLPHSLHLRNPRGRATWHGRILACVYGATQACRSSLRYFWPGNFSGPFFVGALVFGGPPDRLVYYFAGPT